MHLIRSLAMLAIVWGLTCLGALMVSAQVSAFQFDPTRVPVGQVYEYLKSNRDGSRPGQVSLFVAAPDRIESLKWEPGGDEATLVVAVMDWSRFSVRSFDSWKLHRSAPDRLQGSLEADTSGTGVRVSFLPDSLVMIRNWPWHSYDFDFASLGLTLAHLREPEGAFNFERVDVTYQGDALGFADLGRVDLRFEQKERHADRPARRYTIAGPGLGEEPGLLWTDAEHGHLLEFQLPIPDEPGYRDGRLRLQRVRELSPTEWAAYKQQRVGDHGRSTPEEGER